MTLHKSGLLDIVDRRSGKTLWSVGPLSGCANPYTLTLLANGQLVLQDKSGTVIWASTSACRGGNPTCYSYAMLNDGQLVVKDGDGAIIWTSATETGTSSAKQGWTYQITSGGRKDVSCIHSGPTPAAVNMVSQSMSHKLQISQSGAALSLVGIDGSSVWSPSGAISGSPPAQLCITSAGTLELAGSGGARKLWSSSYSTAGTKAGGFYAGGWAGCGSTIRHRRLSCDATSPWMQPIRYVCPLPRM
jgi:hypothetical protein